MSIDESSLKIYRDPKFRDSDEYLIDSKDKPDSMEDVLKMSISDGFYQ